MPAPPSPGVLVQSLHQVALGSSDLERSITFYRDQLGLSLIARFDPPGIAFFTIGGTRLLLERSSVVVPGSSTLYLLVEDVHEAYDTLGSRGLDFESAPHLIHRDDAGQFGAAGEEEWMAFLRDPDGNSVAIAARMRDGAAAGAGGTGRGS